MRQEVEKLVDVFKRNADQRVLVDTMTGRELTYAQLQAYAMALAAILSTKGFQKGDKVGIILGNCSEYAVIYFALMQAALVPVPINPGLHPDEIRYILGYSDVRMILIGEALKVRFEPLLSAFPGVPVMGIDAGFWTTLDASTQKVNGSFLAKVSDDDISAIMYTSGTTSMPKGVVIPYRNVIANGLIFAKTSRIPKGLRFLGVFSQAYMGGWYNAMLIPILSEGTVILDDTFGSNTALLFWDKVQQHQVSALWLTPTMMSILLFTGKMDAKVIAYCKQHIKVAFVGTAPLSPRLKKDFEAATGITFYENYGLSEMFFIAINFPGLAAKDGSVGTVLPGCAVELRKDDGNVALLGEEGEIFVKSQYIMNGYYKDKSLLSLDAKGFFATGDIGVFDEQGHLFITGRKKDLIIRGGLNISSKQIEDKMMELPGIARIACVGIPHNIYGEEVAVVVKLKEEYKGKLTEKDILDYARKNLAQAKYPRVVCFMEQFPESATGKIQKNKLRILLKEKFAH